MADPLPEQKEALLLWAIQDEGYLGRYKLVSILGLPDGITRGLLTKLARKGYLKKKRFVGSTLTTKGKNRLTKLLTDLGIREIKEIDAGTLSLAPTSIVAHIRDKSATVRSGIEQRDAAIKSGAAGAITIIFQDGKLLLPPDRFDLSTKNPTLTDQAKKQFQLLDGDVLVIGSANDRWRAVEGVLGAAQTLR